MYDVRELVVDGTQLPEYPVAVLHVYEINFCERDPRAGVSCSECHRAVGVVHGRTYEDDLGGDVVSEKPVAVGNVGKWLDPELGQEIKHGLDDIELGWRDPFVLIHIPVYKFVTDSNPILFYKVLPDVSIKRIVRQRLLFYGRNNFFVGITA